MRHIDITLESVISNLVVQITCCIVSNGGKCLNHGICIDFIIIKMEPYFLYVATLEANDVIKILITTHYFIRTTDKKMIMS